MRKGNFVRFLDYTDFQPVEVSKDVKDQFSQSITTAKPLFIRIAATHSGKITRNHGFYLPNKMRDGVSSFTDIYPKPIQLHHDSLRTPIGRAVRAAYVDLSGQLHDSFQDAFKERVKDLSAFLDGTMPFNEAVDFVREHLIQDNTYIEDPHYEGLGYVELVAAISEPEAIQQILDGRLLTGSTGAITDAAICSVCRQDWAEDGKCEHRPGKFYDKKRCVLIAGNLMYDEYSFVNKPADRHSRIIEVNLNGFQDFVQLEPDQDNITPDLTLIPNVQQNDSADHDEVVIDDIDQERQKTIQEFWGDQYSEIIEDDPWGHHYADMMGDEEFKDAKLSSAKRKKLSSSTFCGPDRSFPVPDCTHYTAALRLIGRYKGPGDKGRIRACVERKGKRLGCTSSKKDSAMEKEFTPESFDSFSDEELIKVFDVLQSVLTERKMECGCAQQADTTKEDALTAELEAAKTEIEALKAAATPQDNSKLKQLEERVKVAQAEIRFLHNDIDNLTDQLAAVIQEVRAAHVAHLVDLTILSEKDLGTSESLQLSLKDKTGEEITQLLDELRGKVDMQQIIDTLNSGLTNNPTETVDDPTLVADSTGNTQKTEIDKELRKQLRFEYMKVRRAGGDQLADQWLDNVCKRSGITLTKEELLA